MGRDDVIEINLAEIFMVLIGKAWLIISSGIFFALLCLFLSRFVITPLYSSTTKIYILNKEEGATVTYSDVQISTQLTQDYAQLIKSRYVLEEVIQTLHLDMEYDEFYNLVSISTPDDTRIVSITVRDSDPMMAMKEANCVREVASKHIQNVMDIDAINIAELANMPTEKYSPNVKRWGLIGGIGAVVAVSAIIILNYLMDDTIKTSDDVENYLGLSTLAMIPAISDEPAGKKKKKPGSR
ncbi:YveK family protein [Butyrivibrio sp. NC2002]|uniref:YveK family protein n=1 Tax=Butyrivibrio sp. NC2002 TaxID=1410610 RepID=UPI00055DD2CA|nr:Wzz/FepE/Etk N-terminal domain-containing protein [Butyrivibrio sp. NC2002]